MSVTPLIDLADAKAHLNIASTDTSSDAELELAILAATDIINGQCGYSVATPVSETVFTHGIGFTRGRFVLARTPVLSLTAITPVTVGLPLPDMTQVSFDASTGVVYFSNYWMFYGSFRVDYVAGRASVPESLQMACRLIVADLFTTQRGAQPLPSMGGEDPFPAPDGIPPRALQLMRMAPYTAPPGIG